ncbi:MAG: dihydropteroate synthase [Clostridiales bacterium]|nr:dihydropteroate synthase [Clostridiales bacterium]MCD7827073.1 dihydropteroate synthase [Clostridiales bacterium]
MREFCYRRGRFLLGEKPYIMGIVNVTPDSFSDGGKFFRAEKAAEHARSLENQGADILDFGAMSTRPGSSPVTPEEEIKRLEPVLSEIVGKTNAVVSVDTVNPETAEFALRLGADIINDVSGYFNPSMADTVKKYGAGWIVTHTGCVPAGTVLEYPKGVIYAVNEFFSHMTAQCEQYGIDKKFLCLDPGFGFAKTVDDNIELLKNLEAVISDTAFLTGLSRKRFIGALTNEEKAEKRLIGTVAADIVAVMKGSDFIRVHDVKEARQSLDVLAAIRNGDIHYG